MTSPVYRKKKSYSLAVSLVALALAASFIVPRQMAVIRLAAATAIFPFQWTAAVVWKGAVSTPSFFLQLANLSRENSKLKEKLDLTLPQLAQSEELKAENDRLRGLLDFKNGNRFGLKLLPAEVIGRGAAPWNSILEIGRGSSAGLKVNQPVIVKAGLIGKIIEVAPFSAKVLLLTDPQSSIAAADQRSRDFGVVEGLSPQLLKMKYVSAGADVKEGDLIVTSSVSRLFPPGLLIGKVVRAVKKESDLFLQIEIVPAADLSKTEEVLVVI